MTRVTRNLVAAAAASVLLAAVAPAAVAADAVAHSKPGPPAHAAVKGGEKGGEKGDKPGKGKDKAGKPGKGKDKPGKGKGKPVKDDKKLVGERNAAIQIVRARTEQLNKVAKYVTSDTPATVGDIAAKDALLANLAADKEALASTVAAIGKATTVAQVKSLKVGAQAYKASNYEDAADLLYYAAENVEVANEDLTVEGAADAAAKALEAAALLVQVHATNADDLLDAAETLIDESDTLLYGADDDVDEDDEFDDEFEDDFRA